MPSHAPITTEIFIINKGVNLWDPWRKQKQALEVSEWPGWKKVKTTIHNYQIRSYEGCSPIYYLSAGNYFQMFTLLLIRGWCTPAHDTHSLLGGREYLAIMGWAMWHAWHALAWGRGFKCDWVGHSLVFTCYLKNSACQIRADPSIWVPKWENKHKFTTADP